MNDNMSTRRASTDINTGTGADIYESQFVNGSAQTPISTVFPNTLNIFAPFDASMFPFASEHPFANNLRHQLQLNSPNFDRPSSTMSQSTIYTDLFSRCPESVSTILSDLEDTDVIESYVSFKNADDSSNNQAQHE